MPAPPKIEGLPEKFYNPASNGGGEIKPGVQDLDIILK